MSLRNFIDSAGREWQAFDVVPRENERRRYQRRTSDGVGLSEIAMERREADRRLTIGGRTHLHAAAGWLCFECAGERRRLSPIPEHWATATDAQLSGYLERARAVRKSAGINPRR